MLRFSSAFGPVTLTKERKEHIAYFHPEVVQYFPFIASVLETPERTRESPSDKDVLILYRKVPRRRVYLAIVIKKGNHPFILTIYLTNSIKQ